MIYNSMTNCETLPLTDVLSNIVDNRGKSAPTEKTGIKLIATNCINPNNLYPVYEKVRFVSQKTYNSWFRDHPKPGDIIFVNKGTPGRVCLVPTIVDFCIAQDMMAFRVKEDIITNKFLLAFLRSRKTQQQIENFQVGTMIPHFKKKDLNKIMVPIPSKNIQHYIGNFYFNLSEKIEVNNRMNAILENMAQAVFKRWFVDFEFPNEDGEPYKSSGGKMVESELGLIPEGWEVSSLNSVADIVMGQSPKGISYNEEGDGEVFYQGRTDFRERYPKRRLFTTEPKRMAKSGDILMSVRAPVGDINLAYEDCCIGRGLCSIRNKENYTSFILYLMKHLEGKLNVYNGEGTVFGSINKTTLNNMKIVKPEKSVIEHFEKVVNDMDKEYLYLFEQTEVLKKTRDTLLPKLMSGEIRVPFEENEETEG